MYRVPGGYREGTGRVPGGYRIPAVCIFAENAPYRASKKLASSSARPQAAALRDIQPVPQEDQLDQCEVACNALRELFPVFKSLGTKAS